MKQSKINNFFKNNENNHGKGQLYDSVSMLPVSRKKNHKPNMTRGDFSRISDPMQLYEKIRNAQRSSKLSTKTAISIESDNSSSQSNSQFLGNSQLFDCSQAVGCSSQSEDSSAWYQQWISKAKPANNESQVTQFVDANSQAKPWNDDRSSDFASILKSNAMINKQRDMMTGVASMVKDCREDISVLSHQLEEKFNQQMLNSNSELLNTLLPEIQSLRDKEVENADITHKKLIAMHDHVRTQEENMLSRVTQDITQASEQLKTDVSKMLQSECDKMMNIQQQNKKDILESVKSLLSSMPDRVITMEASCQCSPIVAKLSLSSCIMKSKGLLQSTQVLHAPSPRLCVQTPKNTTVSSLLPPSDYEDNIPAVSSISITAGLSGSITSKPHRLTTKATVPYNNSPMINSLLLPPATPFRHNNVNTATPICYNRLPTPVSCLQRNAMLNCSTAAPRTGTYAQQTTSSATISSVVPLTDANMRSSWVENQVNEMVNVQRPITRRSQRILAIKSDNILSEKPTADSKQSRRKKRMKRKRNSVAQTRSLLPSDMSDDNSVKTSSSNQSTIIKRKKSKAEFSVTTYEWHRQRDEYANSSTKQVARYAFDRGSSEESEITLPTNVTSQIPCDDPFEFFDIPESNIKLM